MTAIDRYQAICNPLSNFEWTPKRSNIMISLAWTISLVLCIPQIIIFSFDEDRTQCVQVRINFENVNSRDIIYTKLRKIKWDIHIFSVIRWRTTRMGCEGLHRLVWLLKLLHSARYSSILLSTDKLCDLGKFQPKNN